MTTQNNNQQKPRYEVWPFMSLNKLIIYKDNNIVFEEDISPNAISKAKDFLLADSKTEIDFFVNNVTNCIQTLSDMEESS